KRNHIVLDRQIEIFSVHPRKLGLEHDLVFVFVNIYARMPRSARNSFIIECPSNVAGKKPVHFILKTSQIPKGIVTSNSHCLATPKLMKFKPRRIIRPEHEGIIISERTLVNHGRHV